MRAAKSFAVRKVESCAGEKKVRLPVTKEKSMNITQNVRN